MGQSVLNEEHDFARLVICLGLCVMSSLAQYNNTISYVGLNQRPMLDAYID